MPFGTRNRTIPTLAAAYDRDAMIEPDRYHAAGKPGRATRLALTSE